MFAKMARWALILLAAVATAGLASARPQAAVKPQQTETPAEAARKAKEQKKAEPTSERVWDNDNISLPAGGVEVIGPDANAQATDANGAESPSDQTAANSATAPALSPDELAHLQQAIKESQDKIEDLKKDVDLADRKYVLDAAMFYGKPNFSADKDGQKAINREKSGVDDKKQQLKFAQQMLAELQAKLAAAPAQTSQQKASETKTPDTNAPNQPTPPSQSPDANPPQTNPPPQPQPQPQPQPKPNPPIHES
jgi:hypothetical protein